MQIMDRILFKNKLVGLGTCGKRYGDIYVLPLEQELPVNVSSLGIDYCQELYRNERLNKHVTVLACVLSGEGAIHIGSHSYVCRPGDVFILRKGTQHEVVVGNSAHEFTYLWYNLGGNSLPLLDSFRVPFPPHIAEANVEDLFRKGIRLIEQAKLLESVQIPIMLVCNEILMTLNKMLIQRSSKLSELVLQIMTYLDTIGFQPFDSSRMSQHFNMSFRHLNRIFKAETDTTLYQYLLTRKMETAKVLLKDTSISIGEIAEQLGFTDLYHFSNFFKKRAGCSPLEFRKQGH